MAVLVKPIRNSKDCAEALSEIDRLLDSVPGSDDADRLEVISVLVADYEQRNVRLPDPDPVSFLKFAMASQGRSQADLAQLLGSRSRASEILKRRRALSSEMIEKITAEWKLPYEHLARHYRVQSAAMTLLKRGAAATSAVVVVGFLGLSTLFWWVGSTLPSVSELSVYADVEPRHPVDDGHSRLGFIRASQLPPHVVKAFLAAEDRSYFGHDGYDTMAIARAAIFALPDTFEGKKPSSGATITQQLAKNMILTGEKPSVSRKIKEIILARRLEEALNKDRILELYLNTIYFGGSAYGIADAASFYFGKSVDQLSLSEAAYLAALPKSPNGIRIDVRENVARAIDRRNWVLSRMADDGLITAAVAQLARTDPLEHITSQ